MKKKSNGKSELARIFLKFLAPCWIFWLTATVQAQTPTILSAYGEFDSGTSNQFVDVTFSEDMNPASATAAANYSIAGYTIASAALFTNDLGIASNNLVILQLNQPLTNNFMLMVNNVSSISGAALAANTSVAGTLDPMSSIDITSPNIVPPASSSATVWHTGTTYYRKPVDKIYGTTRTASVSFTQPEQTTLPSSSRCLGSSPPTRGARPV
jgi:hypothetical protein